MLLYPCSVEDNDSFYESVASGCDFYYFQDLPKAGYEETYFNPDCVLLVPDKKEVLWFDLDYTAAALDQTTNTRKHGYGGWNFEKNFGFSYQDNKMAVLGFTLLRSRIVKLGLEEFRSQESGKVTYIVEDDEWDVIVIDRDGAITRNESGLDLEQLWQSHCKMKIAVKLGDFVLIYPIRMAWRHGDIFSFASKNVVIPDLSATAFSWTNSSVGNICVATDGSVSIQRKNKPTSAFENLLPTLFPRLSSKLASLRSSENTKNLIKKLVIDILCKYQGAIKKYVVPYVVEHTNCTFTIFFKRPTAILKD